MRDSVRSDFKDRYPGRGWYKIHLYAGDDILRRTPPTAIFPLPRHSIFNSLIFSTLHIAKTYNMKDISPNKLLFSNLHIIK